MLPGDRVVDAGTPAGWADHLAPPLSREHPFVQPLAGVTEKAAVAAETLTSAVPVERDGEVVDEPSDMTFRRSLSPRAGGPARTVGTYSSSWIRPSKVRLFAISSATSG